MFSCVNFMCRTCSVGNMTIRHFQNLISRVFGSVVAVAFQIAFHAKKHANNIFLFFKNYF